MVDLYEKKKSRNRRKKIRRGPKLEGCAFTNFGNSSGTEGESRHEMLARRGILMRITLRVF